MKIIHSDIKPENILIKKEQGGQYTFKICDFGFAAKHETFTVDTLLLAHPDGWANEWLSTNVSLYF
jgi:serine/threonine protein kinase